MDTGDDEASEIQGVCLVILGSIPQRLRPLGADAL